MNYQICQVCADTSEPIDDICQVCGTNKNIDVVSKFQKIRDEIKSKLNSQFKKTKEK